VFSFSLFQEKEGKGSVCLGGREAGRGLNKETVVCLKGEREGGGSLGLGEGM